MNALSAGETTQALAGHTRHAVGKPANPRRRGTDGKRALADGLLDLLRRNGPWHVRIPVGSGRYLWRSLKIGDAAPDGIGREAFVGQTTGRQSPSSDQMNRPVRTRRSRIARPVQFSSSLSQ